jgi:hypothetical protein
MLGPMRCALVLYALKKETGNTVILKIKHFKCPKVAFNLQLFLGSLQWQKWCMLWEMVHVKGRTNRKTTPALHNHQPTVAYISKVYNVGGVNIEPWLNHVSDHESKLTEFVCSIWTYSLDNVLSIIFLASQMWILWHNIVIRTRIKIGNRVLISGNTSSPILIWFKGFHIKPCFVTAMFSALWLIVSRGPLVEPAPWTHTYIGALHYITLNVTIYLDFYNCFTVVFVKLYI